MKRSVAVSALVSVFALGGCTSESAAPVGAGASVDPSSLYESAGGPGSSGAPGASELPVLSVDDSIPPGETGELVPGVYSSLGEMTPEQKLVLNNAFHLKVAQCMKEQGFTFLEPAPKLEVPERAPVLFDGYIGVLDADYAKSYGYQLNPSSIGFTDAPARDSEEYPSREYELALKEAGNGGCNGEAERLIEQNRPSEDESTALLGRIYQESLDATYADKRYKKVVKKWSSCMREAGFDYATPLKAFSAFDGFALTDAEPNPSAEEVNTAVRDVECKRSSRLADVFRDVFWNKQFAMAKENRPTLKVLDEVNDQLLRNAQAIIKELG